MYQIAIETFQGLNTIEAQKEKIEKELTTQQYKSSPSKKGYITHRL